MIKHALQSFFLVASFLNFNCVAEEYTTPQIASSSFSNTASLSFANKVVVITGGAAGIGREMVRAFARQGAVIVYIDMDSEKGLELSDELAKNNAQYLFITADLTVIDCKQVIDLIIERCGKIDVLINNAGVNDKVGITSPVEDFRASLERNMVHYFRMTHHALDALKQSKGTIINISSKVALTGQGGTSGYAAAKGGILALTREWAVDLAPHGIRVNAIVPAEVLTEHYMKWIRSSFDNHEQRLQEIASKIPFEQRMTTPREIAHTALFLASPLSSHTTGQFLYVDGGYVHLDRACTL